MKIAFNQMTTEYSHNNPNKALSSLLISMQCVDGEHKLLVVFLHLYSIDTSNDMDQAWALLIQMLQNSGNIDWNRLPSDIPRPVLHTYQLPSFLLQDVNTEWKQNFMQAKYLDPLSRPAAQELRNDPAALLNILRVGEH
jgi:hypothetical protein